MHLLRFIPDLGPENPRALETRALLSGHNFIVHAQGAPQAPAVQPERLSVKTAFGGEAVFRLGGRRAVAYEGSYFVVNAGQPHILEPKPATNAELLCVFFDDGFVEETLHAARNPARPLDLPLPSRPQNTRFIEETQPHDSYVSPHLLSLHRALSKGVLSRTFAEELMGRILSGLLQRDHRMMAEVERIPRLRRSTREEIFRRIQRAREFIEAAYADIRSLSEVARVACMSYSHFHRFFSAFYQLTPHRYLTERRLGVALRELRRDRFSITALSYEVGFENVNSFAALFRRRFGLRPSDYRRGIPIADDHLNFVPGHPVQAPIAFAPATSGRVHSLPTMKRIDGAGPSPRGHARARMNQPHTPQPTT